MKTKNVLLTTIMPHPKNPRLHDEANLQAVERSLSDFGQRVPLVVWGRHNYIIAGCGRWEAMKRLGWERCIIVRADELSEEQALAYCIADNKTTDLSEFDFQSVSEILHRLDGAVELESTGFRDFEIEPLMQAEWTPPALKAMPAASDAGGDEESAIAFTAEQWRVVRRAISLVREYEGFEDCSPAEAVVEICGEYGE